MFSLRVTGPDGSTRTYPFAGQQLSIGRDAHNDVVLQGDAVSSRHCAVEITASGYVLVERGSTNGTWLNNRRVDQPTVISEHDRFYVGSFLLELSRAVPQAEPPRGAARPIAVSGPILRNPAPDRAWRDQQSRLQRYADEWERRGRPSRLALKPDELRKAQRWLADAGEERKYEISRLQREFIEASTKVQRNRTIRSVGLAIGGVVAAAGLVTAAVALWPTSEPTPTETPPSEAEPAEESVVIEEPPVRTSAGDEGGTVEPTHEGGEEPLFAEMREEIEHKVVPLETLDDIARRYGVTTNEIVDWNLLNPVAPDIDGKTLLIKHPKLRPLPQQQITYEVEPGETWTKLAARFDVPATRLQAYNQGAQLEPGAQIKVWIDPKPYKPRLPRKPLTVYEADPSAVSVGETNNGSLENGMQLPESPLYIRRNPNIMWGSSFTITNLQTAVAAFRQDVDYEGELILADISKKGGGHFDPHKSHQAGRDIDIWLPTIKGVYKTKYLGDDKSRPRRPLFDEVDWYATWGLVRALIKTGAVQYIFLDYRYQKFVYDAARNMEATQEELDKWIQYPRPSTHEAIFRHSKDHLSHIHVRFKCAPWETKCTGKTAASTHE